MSVEGEVVEMQTVTKVRSGRDFIPMRRIVLEQDNSRRNVTLWREASVKDIRIGERNMALKNMLNIQMDSPDFKPPPITLNVVRLEDQPKVVAWDFGDTVKAATVKHNKVAIVSDGNSLTKVALFEEYASKVTEVGTTILVPQNLLEEADALLHPASPITSIKDCTEGQGYMSVQGEVIEESNRISVTLWREAAMAAANIGELVIISHLKATRTDYGVQLQSSQLTKIENQLFGHNELSINERGSSQFKQRFHFFGLQEEAAFQCRVAICYITYLLSVPIAHNILGLSLPPAFISVVHLFRPAVHVLLPCRGFSSSPRESFTSVQLAC
ncbi:hypothetical protein JOQ06_023739 [Pogonophryne albipinna]|uniref:Uncharacterized protein n=1 Tax=Pogonophryne albipinna TaxID=1090488 RepID=A0AAD6BN33_9TELE|nr:hypothetical protein JOQ06_023739 [Pogonophryne albipinna]